LQIEQILSKETGKRVDLPGLIQVQKEYEQLLFFKEQQEASSFCYPIEVPGSCYIAEIGKSIQAVLMDVEKFSLSPQNPYTKSFDYDKIKNGLQLRTRNPGDQIKLKNGSKKLKDYFIDQKISRHLREKIPLLADGHSIIWVVGYRWSEGYKVDHTTKTVLQVCFYEAEK
jgi:tRNA(Ile)-lysidine synthase